MRVEDGKVGTYLLKHRLPLEYVQSVLIYLKAFGEYKDEKIHVTPNGRKKNGGWDITFNN